MMSNPFAANRMTHAQLCRGPLPTRPHNTMRFDVELGHFCEMAEADPTLKQRLAKSIEAAIINETNRILEWDVGASVQVGGEFLHHQQICYELS